jgi:23S rRNA A2030 N6-methylase RlmJ
MNYRHAFHAGGFADVAKHVALALLVERLCDKPKAFCVLDTHAGLGEYDLLADAATRTWMLEEVVAALAARGRLAMPPAWPRAWQMLSADPDDNVRRLARLVAVRLGAPSIVAELRRKVASHEERGWFLQLLASDDCGVAPQLWGQQCSSPGSGVAGRVLLDVTLSLDELRVR